MILLALALATAVKTAFTLDQNAHNFVLPQAMEHQFPSNNLDCPTVQHNLQYQHIVNIAPYHDFIDFLNTLPTGLIKDSAEDILRDCAKGELFLTLNPSVDFSEHEDRFVDELKNLTDGLHLAEMPLKRITVSGISLLSIKSRHVIHDLEYDQIDIFPGAPQWANFASRNDMRKSHDFNRYYLTRPLLSEISARNPNLVVTKTEFTARLLAAFGVEQENLAAFELRYR